MPVFTPELEFSDDYPTIEPSLRLDFANARALDPRITFTRASTATYVGKDGLIKTAGENEARFDHDPATGESLGLLIEESRLQRIPTSVKATDLNGNSSGTGWTLTANSGVSPDGTTTAVLLSQTQGLANSAILWWNGQMDTGRTFSFFVKHVSGSVNLHGQFGAGDLFTVNLSTGATNASPTSRIRDIKVVNYSNGWKRISIYAVDIGSAASELVGGAVYLCMSSAASDVLLWGFQIEDGTFPTSYIPTSGSTVTRAVDTAQINGIQFHNPSEFVLYAAGRSNTGTSDTSGSTTGCLVALGDTTNNYRFMLRKYRYNPGDGVNTGFTFRYRNVNDGINMDMFPNYYDGGADGYDTTTIAPIWDDFNIHRSALAFEAGVSTDNIRGCADGTLVVPAVTTPGSYSTVSNPGPYTQATTLQIGIGSSSGPFNGTISEVRYYPKRLTNTQLQTLTQ